MKLILMVDENLTHELIWTNSFLQLLYSCSFGELMPGTLIFNGQTRDISATVLLQYPNRANHYSSSIDFINTTAGTIYYIVQ